MKPSGEQVEVPTVPTAELRKEHVVIQKAADDFAEVERKIEHQYVFSAKKVDGSLALGNESKLDPPKDAVTKTETAPTKALAR